METAMSVTVDWGLSNGYCFPRVLDDARLYARALLPAEIERIYLETKGLYR